MGQSPTQMSSTTFDPQRDVHGERPKASFSYPADCNMNHSPPCPSTAVAQKRVNKEVVKRSGKRCSLCGGLFHPRYSCPAHDATCFSCGKPGNFGRVQWRTQKIHGGGFGSGSYGGHLYLVFAVCDVTI